MAFPQTPLDVRTDLQIGGTWTDVTAEIYLRDLITIARGRLDEASRPDPSKCTLTFNNRLGKYSPRNPMGANYGLFGRNTPIRISLPAAANYLRLQGAIGQNATTPDAAALDVLGDIDIRVDATLASWDTGLQFVDLAGKWGADGNRSWRLQLAPGGKLYLVWSPDGTNVNALFGMLATSLPVPPSGRLSVRATLDVNNGAGGNTTSFYYSTTAGTAGPWTLAGTSVLTGTTSIFNSTAALEIGDITGTTTSIPPVGKIHAAEVRNGLAGTVVASPDFSTPAAGAASFVDGAGRTWTMAGGAEISNRDYRFHGEVSSWPSKWDASGKDRYVPVEAAGPLRRYGAGTDPLPSTLRRRIPSDPDLTAYWPMEEGSSATQATSPLAGVSPMATTGMTFAADDTLPGSSALPTLGTTSSLRGNVPSSTSTSWHVEFVYHIDTGPAADANAQFLVVNTSTGQWRIGVGGFGIHIDVTARDGTSLYTTVISPTTGFFGTWDRFVLKAQPSGGSVQFTLAWIPIGGAGLSLSSSFTGTTGHVTSLTGSYDSRLQGMRIGHVAVFDTYDTQIFDNADTGFAGEQAHARIARLCAEQGVPVAFPGGAGPTAAMGPQRPAAFLDLLGECADADMGILFELRGASMLAYRRRSSLYNQPVALALDYAVDGHVAPPLEPVDDDKDARNDITASRTNGSSAHDRGLTGPLSANLPPDGIGPVPGGGTFNVATDDQLPDMAGWLLHLGTWNESRYPSVHVDLSAAPALIPTASALNIGDRSTIAHPPPECGGTSDTLDLIAQGYTETLGAYDWDITANCTPGGPWNVGVLDDTVLGRLDTDGSQLVAAVTATATTLVVSSTGTPWTTAPAEMPFDVQVGGEIVRVTNLTPDVVDAFGRTVSSGWGNADTGQAWTAVGGAGTDFSVSSGSGRHLLTSVNVTRWTTVPQLVADFDVTVTVSTTALATGASQYVALIARMIDTSNCYLARVEFTTTATVALTIRKRVAGTETQLNGGTVTGLTHAANTLFRVRFQGQGTALRAKVWLASGTEPRSWQAVTTDGSFTAAGSVGVRSLLNTGNTNSSPSAVYDDFQSAMPQRMTVTRAINGVAKAQAAGADIRLATPMILAL